MAAASWRQCCCGVAAATSPVDPEAAHKRVGGGNKVAPLPLPLWGTDGSGNSDVGAVASGKAGSGGLASGKKHGSHASFQDGAAPDSMDSARLMAPAVALVHGPGAQGTAGQGQGRPASHKSGVGSPRGAVTWGPPAAAAPGATGHEAVPPVAAGDAGAAGMQQGPAGQQQQAGAAAPPRYHPLTSEQLRQQRQQGAPQQQAAGPAAGPRAGPPPFVQLLSFTAADVADVAAQVTGSGASGVDLRAPEPAILPSPGSTTGAAGGSNGQNTARSRSGTPVVVQAKPVLPGAPTVETLALGGLRRSGGGTASAQASPRGSSSTLDPTQSRKSSGVRLSG